jgi:hypothetical protein
MVIALNKNQLGYSICNTDMGDKYDDQIAFKIAYSRATSQKICDYNFWKKVIERHMIKNGYTYKDYYYNNFEFFRENNNSVMVEINIEFILHELKYMQERANKYFKED